MLKSSPELDISVDEVARILAALRAGVDPGKLTREFAPRRAASSGTAGYLVDIGLACLWLSEGAPAGDVLTMLESRHRFEFSSATCRAHPVEILWAAEHHMQTIEVHLNTTSKEHDYAVA